MKISVIVPAYNAEKYIKEAVDSILNQTFADFECIVINDGSNDTTLSILQAYNDSRLKIISRENRGLVATLNEGLDIAQGEYIARMDADDISLPTRFEKQVEFLDNNVDYVVVGTNIARCDKDGNFVKNWCYPKEVIGNIQTMQCPTVAHPSAMIRASAIHNVGGYRPYFWGSEDADFWWRLEEVGKIYCLQEPLLKYRWHGENVTLNLWAHRRVMSDVVAGYCAKLRRSGKSDTIFSDKNLSEKDGFLLHKTDLPIGLIGLAYMRILYATAKKTAILILRKILRKR